MVRGEPETPEGPATLPDSQLLWCYSARCLPGASPTSLELHVKVRPVTLLQRKNYLPWIGFLASSSTAHSLSKAWHWALSSVVASSSLRSCQNYLQRFRRHCLLQGCSMESLNRCSLRFLLVSASSWLVEIVVCNKKILRQVFLTSPLATCAIGEEILLFPLGVCSFSPDATRRPDTTCWLTRPACVTAWSLTCLTVAKMLGSTAATRFGGGSTPFKATYRRCLMATAFSKTLSLVSSQETTLLPSKLAPP